jgi:hypothetical protein
VQREGQHVDGPAAAAVMRTYTATRKVATNHSKMDGACAAASAPASQDTSLRSGSSAKTARPAVKLEAGESS